MFLLISWSHHFPVGLVENRQYISDDIGECYKSVYAPQRGGTYTVQARGESPAPTPPSLSHSHTHMHLLYTAPSVSARHGQSVTGLQCLTALLPAAIPLLWLSIRISYFPLFSM